MTTIRNKEQLVRNGVTELDRKARTLALESLEHALNAADPKKLMNAKLLLRNSVLEVNGYRFDLRKFGNVYVVGGGKASEAMAANLEEYVGIRIANGLVNIPRGTKHRTEIIRLHEASHPIPDEAGVEGTRIMSEIAGQAEEEDLIICLISGGGSSLMPLPRDGITIGDKGRIVDTLLRSGATINEINTVRKHISDFKGGWLARRAYPATVLNLILSDVVGDPLDSIASGPTVPDSTTFTDAVNVLKRYGLWGNAPTSIKEVLSDGQRGIIPETPKASDKAFKKVYNVIIGNNRSASQATCQHLKSIGLNTLLLTTTLEGEARHVGVMLASVALEVSISGNPIPKPAGIVAGGETTVTVAGRGKGGRNQEIALAAAPKISGANGVVVASLTTDGVDGPTDAAGAIADGKTSARAAEKILKSQEFLVQNDSYNFFSKLDDLIFTGPTDTNVNDVSVIVVL